MDNLSEQEIKRLRNTTFILVDFLRAMIPLMTSEDLAEFQRLATIANERLLTKEEFQQFHELVEKFAPPEHK
jgi:hypothetical protein